MDEDIIAHDQDFLETGQEVAMGRRNPIEQLLDDLGIVQSLIVLGRDAVTDQRLAPADSTEEAQCLVIAFDGPRNISSWLPIRQ